MFAVDDAREDAREDESQLGQQTPRTTFDTYTRAVYVAARPVSSVSSRLTNLRSVASDRNKMIHTSSVLIKARDAPKYPRAVRTQSRPAHFGTFARSARLRRQVVSLRQSYLARRAPLYSSLPSAQRTRHVYRWHASWRYRRSKLVTRLESAEKGMPARTHGGWRAIVASPLRQARATPLHPHRFSQFPGSPENFAGKRQAPGGGLANTYGVGGRLRVGETVSLRAAEPPPRPTLCLSLCVSTSVVNKKVSCHSRIRRRRQCAGTNMAAYFAKLCRNTYRLSNNSYTRAR